MVDPLIMLVEVFVFVADFPPNVQDALKSSIFEIEVAPFKSAQLLNMI